MLTLLLAIAALATAQTPVRPQAPAKTPTLQDVRWLGGCWLSVAEDASTHEYWFDAGSDAFIGLNRMVKGGVLGSYEFMLIRVTPAGLAFTAKPSGQPEATFIAERAGENEIVFSNPKHDFPQRVIYRRGQPGTLQARIEGTVNGQPRAVDFSFRRMQCPYAPTL